MAVALLSLLTAALPTADAAPRSDEAPAAADASSEPSAHLALGRAAERPPDLPTAVRADVHVVGLSHVSAPSEAFPTFDAELLLTLQWSDPRLAFDPALTEGEPARRYGAAAHAALGLIWTPDLTVINEEGPRRTEHVELELWPDGRARVVERFGVTAHADVDLRRFPFDRQQLALDLSSFTWDADHLTLQPGDATLDPAHRNLEWLLGEATLRSSRSQRLGSDAAAFDHLHLTLAVTREPGFYLYKLLIPLLMIVASTWSAFFLRGEPSAGRMQRTFIALLTVVAFHHVVASHLPRISYLTFVDAVVYASFAAVLGVLVTVVQLHEAERAGQAERVAAMERRARLAHPAAFAALLTALWAYYHL